MAAPSPISAASTIGGRSLPSPALASAVPGPPAWIFLPPISIGPADFVACSVYKFFGPHLGALYGRRAIMNSLPAYKVGPAEHRFETGTGNHEGDAGAVAAVDYLADLGARFGGAAGGASRRERLLAGMRTIRAYELDLYRYLAGRLGELDGVRILGLTA